MGAALLAAGQPVNAAKRSVLRIGRAYHTAVSVAIFPTTLIVRIAGRDSAPVDVTTPLPRRLPLGQTERLLAIGDRVREAKLTPRAGVRQVELVLEQATRRELLVSSFGGALLSTGVALILGAGTVGTVFAAVAGWFVATADALIRGPFAIVRALPVVAAFIVGICAMELAHLDATSAPVTFVIIPPLVVLLPGEMLSTSMLELASNEMVAGASRLVAATMQFVLLIFGIALAAQAAEPFRSLSLAAAPSSPGWTVSIAGLACFAVGALLRERLPRRDFVPLLMTMAAAYGGQKLKSFQLGGYLAGFCGALAAVVVAVFSYRFGGPAPFVAFVPAYWLLVPGALALAGLGRIEAGFDPNPARSILEVAYVLVSISLGVLIGAVVAELSWGRRALLNDPGFPFST